MTDLERAPVVKMSLVDEDIGDFAADIVSALPLTPEEPKT